MPNRSREVFAKALIAAANGQAQKPFKSLDTAAAYLEQLHTVLNDIGAIYPHGCAEEVLTRIQALSGNQMLTIEELGTCQTLDELQHLLTTTDALDQNK